MSPEEEQRLLTEIFAHPDEDAPRLAYAKLLEARGDPRGEFIRLEILKAKREITNLQFERWRQLALKYGDQWEAPVKRLTQHASLYRGFVARIVLDAQELLRHADELFALAPIQHVNLTNAKPVFAKVCAFPALARLRSLSLTQNHLDDTDAQLLAASPYIRNLRWLDLSYNLIGMPGLEAFAASPNVDSLQFLGLITPLVENPIGHDSIDWDGTRHQNPPPASQVAIESKYGRKQWLHPAEDPTDRYTI